MKKVYLIGSILCIVLVGCGPGAQVTSLSTAAAGTAQPLPATEIVPPTTDNQAAELPSSAVPAPATAAPPLPAPATAGLPTDWTAADWAGLMIPVPPQHIWEPVVDGMLLETTTPIMSQSQIRFDRAANPEIRLETPSGVSFAMLLFDGSPQEWLAQVQVANPMAVDAQSVQETTIAGQPGLVYSPVVTGTGLAQMYVVAIEPGKLLWISTDIVYPNYADVIAGIRPQD